MFNAKLTKNQYAQKKSVTDAFICQSEFISDSKKHENHQKRF